MRFHVEAWLALLLCSSLAAATNAGDPRPRSSQLRGEKAEAGGAASEETPAVPEAEAPEQATPPRGGAPALHAAPLEATEPPARHAPREPKTHLADHGPVLLQRERARRRKSRKAARDTSRVFRQPRRDVEERTEMVWGVPKLVWVVLADIMANALFVSCIPLVMFLSKRRRPNFDEPTSLLPESCPCGQAPPKQDRMSV